MHLTPTEDRIVVVNYFLKFGILNEDEALTLAVFDIDQKKKGLPKVTYDPTFNVDFSPDRPHAVASFSF